MNIDSLLRRYFNDSSSLEPTIEVFDDQNIHQVYTQVVNLFKSSAEIELSVLQLLSYCFYEILDNVVTHSGKKCGTIISRFVLDKNMIQILVADDGIGIKCSLRENDIYKNISEEDALLKCLQDKVTDGKGMGYGLFSTLCLIRNAGIRLEIHSGNHLLISDGKEEKVVSAPLWQGTLLYIELKSDQEIDPNRILDGRVDAETEFNEEFLDFEDIDNLW